MIAEDSPIPWQEIARSPFYGLYLHELCWLATDVVQRADRVFEQAPPPDANKEYLRVDLALHAELYAILGSAAKIRAMIEDRPRRRNQTLVEHETLVSRAQAMRELLSGLEYETVLSPAARHSVEHFDERLDRTGLAARDGKLGLPVSVMLDVVVSTRAAFELFNVAANDHPDATMYPLRVYVAAERVFLNADDELDIGALRSECAAISERLHATLSANERGALIVVLTPQSFCSGPSDDSAGVPKSV